MRLLAVAAPAQPLRSRRARDVLRLLASLRSSLASAHIRELEKRAFESYLSRMSGGGRTVELTDPRALRALAHPARLELMGLLRRGGPLTATQAGERMGESAACCSFH